VRVSVLGAGVAGVVTAYYLARCGHAVTVLEQASEVAAGASFANAGQLSYSFTDALARPSFLVRLPSLLLNRDPGIRVRTRPNREFLRWGLAFLRQCTPARARDNTIAVLELAKRSSVLLNELLDEMPLEFSYRRAGKLVLLSSDAELATARQAVELKRRHGCSTRILGRQEALEIEPALSKVDDEFMAAVYSDGDAVADARAFTAGLAQWLSNNTDAQIRLGERVTSIVTSDGTVSGVRSRVGEHPADAVVVCLGSDSGELLRPLNLSVPICPVRGYSVTLPAAVAAPSASITHLRHRIVISRIGASLRAAGFADFVALDTRHDATRIEALLALARRFAPHAADFDSGDRHSWGGFRPMTPDSRPLVGPTRIPGLYLNTGHGMLGWTLACATGAAVADWIGKS
jgi:D-amino-acid dehydrogenase